MYLYMSIKLILNQITFTLCRTSNAKYFFLPKYSFFYIIVSIILLSFYIICSFIEFLYKYLTSNYIFLFSVQIPNIICISFYHSSCFYKCENCDKKQLFDLKVKGQGPTKVITVHDTPPYGHAPTYQIS
jgi:hypothetical protein